MAKAGTKAATAAPKATRKKEAKVTDGGARRPADRTRPDPRDHNVDGDNGSGHQPAREPIVLDVGTAVIVRQHNGNDSGRTGVIEHVPLDDDREPTDNRLVHLSDGRHIVFVLSQLVEPEPVPPDEYA